MEQIFDCKKMEEARDKRAKRRGEGGKKEKKGKKGGQDKKAQGEVPQ
jgi:hypothetical protein